MLRRCKNPEVAIEILKSVSTGKLFKML